MRRPSRPATLGTIMVLVLLGAGALVPFVGAVGDGVGVAPSTLSFTDPPLQPDVAKTMKLHFQQRQWAETVDATVKVAPLEGAWGDASSWLTITPGGNIRVPYTDDFPVNVSVAPPATAANGLYKASVVFTAHAPSSGSPDGSGATLPRSVTATVEIEVNNEHQVQRIRIDQSPTVFDAEEGGPFQLTIPLSNTGNVDADPRVRVTVQDKFQEQTLVVYWFNGTALSPGESRAVSLVRPEIDLPRDQYWAVIDVFLGGVQVGASFVKTFDVVEKGALARSAELRTIKIDGGSAFAKVGQLIKISAVVRNTGQAPLEAQFNGEVHRDGQLVDTISSAMLEVPIGEERELEMFYTAKEAGRHEFMGRVHYGSKVTEQKSLIVTMDGAAFDVPWPWLGAGLLILIVAGAALMLVKHRGRDGSGGRGRSAGQPPARSRRAGSGRPATRRPGGAPSRSRPAPAAGSAPRRPAAGPRSGGGPRPGPSRGAPPRGPAGRVGGPQGHGTRAPPGR